MAPPLVGGQVTACTGTLAKTTESNRVNGHFVPGRAPRGIRSEAGIATYRSEYGVGPRPALQVPAHRRLDGIGAGNQDEGVSATNRPRVVARTGDRGWGSYEGRS